ncbi:hypothetical protein, partial [Myxococcus sp. AM011]|uniref:hypothetical protein n=1 Tax=Myxococcus sp. AM011 TaxID=2745200 RepID=UPI0034CE86CE
PRGEPGPRASSSAGPSPRTPPAGLPLIGDGMEPDGPEPTRIWRTPVSDTPREAGALPRGAHSLPDTSFIPRNSPQDAPALGSRSPSAEPEPTGDVLETPLSTLDDEAAPMSSSSRITSGFGQLARLLLKSPSGVPRAMPQVPEGGGLAGRGKGDAFRTEGTIPGGHPTLGGQERAPVRRVAELIPPGLEKVAGQEELGLRFGSDAALLAQHLKPSQLSSSERATRLWAFFAAYAETAVAQPSQKEGQEAFRDSLKAQGFAELRDARTGQDGVTQGLWVLNAGTPEEARERVATVRLEPPPEVRHSEAAVRKEGLAEGGLAMQARGPDTLRGGPAPLEFRASESEESEDPPQDSDGRRRASGKRLGPMMLWNVLHRFRSEPEDGAVAQGQWDRVAFGAMLALVGIALVVLALVSL